MVFENYELANPNAASLIQSLRAFGYDISTAIADLIDNSITAQANSISVLFEWNNGDPWISIADNGYGMSEAELFEAMKPGSKNPLDERTSDDLGRFGLGLKTASFSQCKRFTVASKKANTEVYTRCWDLDIVTNENAWILLKYASENANKRIAEHFDSCEHGTIVIWEKLDRIVPGTSINDGEYQNAFLSYARAVKDHIAVVFSSYMHGAKKVHFFLNERPVQMWDPFMADNACTTRMPTESIYVNRYEVRVKTYILPHQSKLSVEEFNANAGLHGWNAQQGFYIYRNNRLIVAGDWLIPGMEKLEQYRLARIRVDIGNETDSEWNIDVRKSTAMPPICIQKEMKRIATVAQRESSRIYRHRGKRLARTVNKEQYFVWHQNVRHGKLGYEINRDHPIIKNLLQSDVGRQIKQLINLIEETIPVPMIARSSIKLQGSHEPLQLIFLPRRTLKMEKMTIRKMLERIVVATNKREVKNIFLVSTDGEIVKAEFAVDLIQKLAKWNFLWEVNVISAKFYDDYFTVIFNADIEQVNGDPDKGDTWL